MLLLKFIINHEEWMKTEQDVPRHTHNPVVGSWQSFIQTQSLLARLHANVVIDVAFHFHPVPKSSHRVYLPPKLRSGLGFVSYTKVSSCSILGCYHRVKRDVTPPAKHCLQLSYCARFLLRFHDYALRRVWGWITEGGRDVV